MATTLAAEAQTGFPFGNDAAPSVLFVSREPVFHQRNGATAAAVNLLGLLRERGVAVTVLVTLAASRSPRLSFHTELPLPGGTALQTPGYVRVGRRFLRPFTPWTWLHRLLRGSHRSPALAPLRVLLQRAVGDRLFAGSWDLNEPTAAEEMLVRHAVTTLRPTVVIANYAFWGPLLATLKHNTNAVPHTAILMHDLLAEHVRAFRKAGMPLDCNPIDEAQETAWLNGADTLIAVQSNEAAAIRGRVCAEVFVQPIVMQRVPAPNECGSDGCDPERCLFVGSGSPPNVQGALWLVREVWPLVLKERPRAVLAIAGDVCERVPACSGVHLLGRVPSLAREYRQATVCLVPLRVGTGLKMKLLEALSYGKATVSTAVGVQGVESWAEGVIGVSDDPAAFTALVTELFDKPDLRQERERAAGTFMHEHYGAESAAQRALFQRLFGSAISMPA